MTNLSIITSTTATMTSLDLVEFINSQRGAAEGIWLRHDHFMAKVPKVLGEILAPKLLGTSNYLNGAGNSVPRPIYHFPKREACLMAMSYSYELQAKVFDKMTALEQQAGNPAIPQTMSAALRLAADQADQIEVQQAQLAVSQPKAEALDRIATAEDGLNNHECPTYIGYFWLPRPPIQ
jgi:hypothetical protein